MLDMVARWRRTVREEIMKDVWVDRRNACLQQAELCRNRAKVDSIFRPIWIAEATKWQRRADEECVGDPVGVKAVVEARPKTIGARTGKKRSSTEANS